MPRYPSASILQRALACPVSLCLPQLPDEGSDNASRGTEIHSWAARQVDSSQPDLPLSDENQEYVDRLDLTAILARRQVRGAELTFAYDPGTRIARLISKEENLDYRNSNAVIGGTADLLLCEPDGTWVVLDWKTGSQVEHPSQNKQLLFFALCLSVLTPTPAFDPPDVGHGVAGEIAFLDAVTAQVTLVRALFTPEAIAVFQTQLHTMLDEIARAGVRIARGQPVTPTPGAHCKYCPAFALCPAQRHLARALAAGALSQGDLLPTWGAIQMLTPREAGVAWQRLKELKQLLGLIEYELRCYAEEMPIELPNKTTLRLKEKRKESLDAEIVREVLTAIPGGGPRLAELCSSYTVSKASLTRGLKAAGMNAGVKALRDILEIVADRGGVTVNTYQALTTALPDGSEVDE